MCKARENGSKNTRHLIEYTIRTKTVEVEIGKREPKKDELHYKVVRFHYRSKLISVQKDV